jgi:hypothetical protein
MRADAYQRITDQIVSELEEGRQALDGVAHRVHDPVGICFRHIFLGIVLLGLRSHQPETNPTVVTIGRTAIAIAPEPP